MADHLVLKRGGDWFLVDKGVGTGVAHGVLGTFEALGVAFGMGTVEELGWNLAEVRDLGLNRLPLSEGMITF